MINTDDERVKKYIIIIFVCISIILNIHFNKQRDPSTSINMSTILQYNHERLFVLFKKNIEKFEQTPLLIKKNKENPGLFISQNINASPEIIYNCFEFQKLDLDKYQPITIRDNDVMVRFFRECNFIKHGKEALPGDHNLLNEININYPRQLPESLLKFLISDQHNSDLSYKILNNSQKSSIELLNSENHFLIQEIARADFDLDSFEDILFFVKQSSPKNHQQNLRYILISKTAENNPLRMKEIEHKLSDVLKPNIYRLKYNFEKSL